MLPKFKNQGPFPRSEREAGRAQFVASPPALARCARRAELGFPGEAALRPGFGAGRGRLRAVLISCGAPAFSFLEMLAERVLAWASRPAGFLLTRSPPAVCAARWASLILSAFVPRISPVAFSVPVLGHTDPALTVVETSH